MKEIKNILKGAVVFLIVAVMVLSTVTATANTKETKNIKSSMEKPMQMGRTILFQDDFESYDDFAIDFPPWIQVDVDGATTYGMTSYNYPNESYVGSFMIFNPSLTTPPVPDAPPHSGAKFAACFNAILPAANDDWLITPQQSSTTFDEVTFWARSYTDAYNLDRFSVGISTTDTTPSSFTIISPGNYIEAPIEWTQYTYDISGYTGNIYIAIHCVSSDSFILMVDDFMVTEEEVIPPVPAICCDGNLLWEKVKAGSTVNGTFEISNCGEVGSLLNWEVDISELPNWGTWTFTPESGTGLAEGDSVTITVEVVAPAQKKKTFTGTIKMINSDNTSDFCEIDVSLKTPRSRTGFNLLQWILQRYPNMFPILRNIIA